MTWLVNQKVWTITRNAVIRALYARKGALGPRLGNWVFGLEKYEVTTLRSFTGHRIKISAEPSPLIGGLVSSRNYVKKVRFGASLPFNAVLLENATLSLNRRGGFALHEDKLLTRTPPTGSTAQIVFGGEPVAGECVQVEAAVALKRPQTVETIPAGIYVGSLAPHNWFHWIIDTLPVIHFLRHLPPQFQNYPVLLPPISDKSRDWHQSLRIALRGRPIKMIDAQKLIKVRSLVMTEGASTAFPRPWKSQQQSGRIFFRENMLTAFADEVRAKATPEKFATEPTRRLFIGRKSGGMRDYNQDEIFEVAGEYGFELVFLEDLPFRNSVRLFNEAQIVIGPHGAGFANILFSQRGTTVLIWTWKDQRGDNWYESLFAALDMQAAFLHYEPLPPHETQVDPRGAPYTLNVENFRTRLEEVLVSADSSSDSSK